MKKYLAFLLSLLLIVTTFVLSGCSGTRNTVEHLEGEYSTALAGTELNVFNWGEYISDGSEGMLDVNAAFEKLTGIKVNYSNYDSNETMYSKLKSGASSYDIIIPSDYMIQRLISENMLSTLDTSSLSNYKYIAPQYKNLYYDPENKYSVPYNVGMVGLIYNTKTVKKAPESWDIMWDKQYKDQILTFNNSRDAFAIAQFLIGVDINSENKADWDKAAKKLKEQTPLLQGRVMDEVFNKMESGNAAIAPYYAGDFLTMKSNNPDLEFVYPKEGTNIFVDSVCIPKNCQNYEAAMLYINFLLEPEVALENAEYLCYASPNTEVINNDDYSFKGNPILYPAKEQVENAEYFHDLDSDVRSHYEKLWESVIASK